MPLRSDIVGQAGEPLVHEIEARWTMSYAAGLGDFLPVYMDTLARPDPLAHPLFPVCFEWPAFLSHKHLPDSGLELGEAARGVHATHDLVLHRPLRAGTTVTTRARVVSVEARRPGAYQVTRLDSVDTDGGPVCTTWYGTLLRGVSIEGGDRSVEGGPLEAPTQNGTVREEIEIPIAPEAAHVYTECARIWNPIHTDAAVAKAAGLPALILHGTATLGLAVSRVVERALGGELERVGRIGARFGGMVLMPSVARLQLLDAAGDVAHFQVLNEKGETAIRDGFVALR